MSTRRYVARLLAPLALVACAALALPASSAAASSCPNAKLLPSGANVTQLRAATLCLLNNERADRGLERLSSNRHLLKAAQTYSRLMVRKQFFAHISPSGSTLTSRVRRHTRYLRGARSWRLGENLAWGEGARATPAETVAAWMDSPGHRANILTPGFRSVGIGIAEGAPRPTGELAAATYTSDFGRRS